EQRTSPWPQAPIHAGVRTRPGREDCRPRLHPISSAVVSVWREEMLFRPEANVRAMEDALTPVRLLSQARCAPRRHFDRENAIWYEIRLIATRVGAGRRGPLAQRGCGRSGRPTGSVSWAGVWVSIQSSFVVLAFRLV